MRRRISGLSIAYPPSCGQRVPDASLSESRLYELMRSGRFILLDRNDDGRVARAVKEGWADRIDIVRSSITATPDWPAVLLVRPYGYAAWATHVSAPGEQLSAGRRPAPLVRPNYRGQSEIGAPWYAVVSPTAYREPVIWMAPVLLY